MITPRRVAAVLAILAASFMASSAHATCGVLKTGNQTPYWAWITVYMWTTSFKVDYGWVAPFSTREWRAGGYTCGNTFKVRAEIKGQKGGANPPGDTPNIGDTTVEYRPTNDAKHGYPDTILHTTPLAGCASQPPTTWTWATSGFYWGGGLGPGSPKENRC